MPPPPRLLGRTNVLSLPALGSFGHVELHGLTFLQASETAGLNGGEMNENVFARLAADKAIALGVIEPLYCSLFHMFVLLFLLCSYAGWSRKKNLRRLLAVEARAAHDRFGLTHQWILLSPAILSNVVTAHQQLSCLQQRIPSQAGLGVSSHQE